MVAVNARTVFWYMLSEGPAVRSLPLAALLPRVKEVIVPRPQVAL